MADELAVGCARPTGGPVGEPAEATAQEATAPIKDEELVLQFGNGYRSNIAASNLRQAGYAHVKSLAGGVFAWSNAGFILDNIIALRAQPVAVT